MSTIDLLVHFLPIDKKVKVKAGTTILRAARAANVAIVTRCGGNSSCLMCKVTVNNQQGLTELSPSERHKLGPLIDKGVRLACQAKVTQSVSVELPPDPLRAAIAKQLQKQNEDDKLW